MSASGAFRSMVRFVAVSVVALVASAVRAPVFADVVDDDLGDGIGTFVDDAFGDGSMVPIDTSVSSVEYSEATRVHRRGLEYLEVTGSIRGIGWGGEWEDLFDPFAFPVDAFVAYEYDVPFVLRWSSDFDGTLVHYAHGRSSLGLLTFVDGALGDDDEGRRLEREGDFVSDAVVAGGAKHAFFSANLNGLRGDGSFSILGLEPPFLGEPLKATFDVPLGRDLVRVASRLLARLSHRGVERVIGTGHSAGAILMQYADGGITDSPNSGVVTFTGGDYVTPYEPASGTIYQAFVPLAGGNWRLHPTQPMAVPMLMIGGLAEVSAMESVRYAWRLQNAGVDLASMFRTYQVRDLPHSWAEIVESTPNFNAFLAGVFGVEIHADGDRMQPVVGALLDAAIARVVRGAPPPASRIDGVALDTDGVGGVDAIGFAQASGPPTIFVPSVFDPVLDVYDGFPFELSVAGGFPVTVARYAQMLAAIPHGPALALPKVTCRLGGFRISEMLSDSELLPFDFDAHWKNAGAYRSCLAKDVATLRKEGLYR